MNTGLALGVSPSATANDITITTTEGGTGLVGTTTLTVKAAAARYAYVGNLASQSISGYTVNVANGTFTPLATFSSTSPGPRQVLLHPSDGCSLHSIFIDSTSGVLTTTQQPVQATSTSATCVGAIDPLGRFIYTLSAENNAIYGFSITSATAQTGKTGPTVAALKAITGVGPYVLHGAFRAAIDKTSLPGKGGLRGDPLLFL